MVAVLAVFVTLIVATSIRVGARQPEAPDLRTFVFVRTFSPPKNIEGARVVFKRMSDGETWIFPYTKDGGWTKRFVPDGKYLVSVKAEGYRSQLLTFTVPSGKKFPHRTFEVWMEKK